MEKRQQATTETAISFDEYFDVLKPVMWKIVLLSLAVGIVTLVWMFLKPDLYKASAIIVPAVEEEKESLPLGVISSFGISVGGPSKVEDLETLFKSKELTVRVFHKYDLWPIVLQDRFDPKTGKMKAGWMKQAFGLGRDPEPPSDWDAIRVAENSLNVYVQRKSGTLTISFESPVAEESAKIVQGYLDEAKNRLQERALERARRNKKFIEEQLRITVDVLTHDRLYSLYGKEMEREMMARNREQFGFVIIDPPRVPDRKSGPHRAFTAVAATTLSFPVWSCFFIYRGRRRENTPEAN